MPIIQLTRRGLIWSATGLAVTLGAGLPALAEAPDQGSVIAVPNTKGPLRIAFLSFQNNPFWIPVTQGAMAAKKYLAGFNTTLDYVDLGNTLSAEAVVAGVEAAMAKQYNGIVLVPIFDGTASIINQAVADGIPVVNIVAEGAVPSKRLTFIGQDAYAAGQQIGAFIATKMNGAGKLGVITGYFGATQHMERMKGAIDYLKAHAPGITIIGPFENHDAAEKAYSIVQDMETAHPDLSMVYVTAGGPFGAGKAIKDLGLTGKVGVVGFDHTPENMEYLKSGQIIGLLDQAPFRQGYDGSVILYNYLINGAKPASHIAVQGQLLTPADVK